MSWDLNEERRRHTATVKELQAVRALNAELFHIAKRWAALDRGSWNPQRHALEKAALLADTSLVIDHAEGRDA